MSILFDYFADANGAIVSEGGIVDGETANPANWSGDVSMGVEAISDADAAALDAQMVGRLPYTTGAVNGDRLLAIIAQDMASFGAQSGEDGRAGRREGVGKPAESSLSA